MPSGDCSNATSPIHLRKNFTVFFEYIHIVCEEIETENFAQNSQSRRLRRARRVEPDVNVVADRLYTVTCRTERGKSRNLYPFTFENFVKAENYIFPVIRVTRSASVDLKVRPRRFVYIFHERPRRFCVIAGRYYRIIRLSVHHEVAYGIVPVYAYVVKSVDVAYEVLFRRLDGIAFRFCRRLLGR